MSFSDETIQKVWEKGKVVSRYDPDKWRKDECDAWIRRNQYGDRDLDYGWEIHHIKPESEGGTNDLSNLLPLQWDNNVSTQEGGSLVCVVTSSNNKNVYKSSTM